MTDGSTNENARAVNKYNGNELGYAKAAKFKVANMRKLTKTPFLGKLGQIPKGKYENFCDGRKERLTVLDS